MAAARAAGRQIGFVPTMGALHAGHLSLIERARGEGTYTVVSIFVNPTQFSPGEDFERYPRDEAGDLRLCEQAGVELVFAPAAAELYAPDESTRVHVAGLTETLCGPHRPGHFDGVATVVTKLLNIVQPDRAYFGRKDAQQLLVVRRLVRDLCLPVEVVDCPTVRDPDGLALSSRNAYLSPPQRRQAVSLYAALRHAEQQITGGIEDARTIIAEMERILRDAGPVEIDYVSIVDAQTLQPVERIAAPVLVALAVRIGRTRLIDNVSVDPPRRGG